MTVSERAGENRVLTGTASAERGAWRTQPYQREPMDVMSPNHPSKLVVLMSAAQMLKCLAVDTHSDAGRLAAGRLDRSRR